MNPQLMGTPVYAFLVPVYITRGDVQLGLNI